MVGIVTTFLFASAAAQATVLMYIVVNPVVGSEDTVFSKAKSASLMNCKQLVEREWDLIIIRLQCNNQEDFKKALSTDLIPTQHITSSTNWVVPPTVQ